jgi:2-iminobutanoate/2-iminopropanoate deaminase
MSKNASRLWQRHADKLSALPQADAPAYNRDSTHVTGQIMRQVFMTDKAAKPSNPYSHAVVTSGKQLWISGQVPVDPATGKMVEGDFAALATRVFENTKIIAEAAGASLANAVKVTVYLRDNNDFAAMNEIYMRYFPEPRGARTTVHSNLRNTPIEIDCVLAMDTESVALGPVRAKHIGMMGTTLTILQNLARSMTPTQASTLRDARDGDKGWTPVQVLGHLLDSDRMFQRRAALIQISDYPALPVFDHEAEVASVNYNARSVASVMDELTASRQRFIAMFKALTPHQWERAGQHPESGHFSMTNSVMQVASHDAMHIEQITRILAQSS